MINEKPFLITTPNMHIPIGEPTLLNNGEPALRIKGKGPDNFDTIRLSDLVSQIVLVAHLEEEMLPTE